MAIVPVCIQVPGDLPSLQVIRTMFLRQDLHLCIICIVACPTSLQGPVRVEVYKLQTNSMSPTGHLGRYNPVGRREVASNSLNINQGAAFQSGHFSTTQSKLYL